MDYKAHYDRLIETRRELKRERGEQYYELHHIVPRSEGGTDDESNLILLTAKEHYVAHLLMWRAEPDNQKRLYSVYMMSHRFELASGRLYEQMKESLGYGSSTVEENKRKMKAYHKEYYSRDDVKKKRAAYYREYHKRKKEKAAGRERALLASRHARELQTGYSAAEEGRLLYSATREKSILVDLTALPHDVGYIDIRR